MKRKTKSLAILVILVMVITLFPAGNCYATFNNLNIAIYADTGTDARTITALCQAFARMGHNPMAIAEGDLIHNRLTTSNFDVLVIPTSLTSVEDLNTTIDGNEQKILDYVSSGGGLIAIGAAAKLLCANSINSSLAIYGANATALNDVGEGMAQIKICNSDFGTVGTKYTTYMSWYAASYGTAAGATPIAQYSDTGANSSNTNAIVGFGYGNGQVCLVGPELELEEKQNVDLSAWDNFYNSFYDPESELGLLAKIVEYAYSGSVLNNTIVVMPSYGGKKIAVCTEHQAQLGGSWPGFLPAVFTSILNSGNYPIAITPADIAKGKLTTSNYDAIVFPGGYAYGYSFMLDGYEQQIRDFVNSGGGIMGICAGAYYLSDWISWEGEDYEYPVNIFNGGCVGPLEDIATWPGRNLVNIDLTDLTLGLNGDYTTTYYGGGYFLGGSPTPISSAKYEYGGNYDYQDAIIRTYYGTGMGRVLLTGPHLEAEEGSTDDWCFWDNYQYDSDYSQTDPESEWGLLDDYYGWIAGNNTNATSPGGNGTTLGVRRGIYDNAGDSLGDTQRKSDGNDYVVGKTKRMELQGFGLGSSSTINSVLLKVRYFVQSGSTANSYIQYRKDGSLTYYNTTIQPLAGSTEVEATFDLKAVGVDTLAEVQSLVISYYNNSTVSKKTYFDYVQVVVN